MTPYELRRHTADIAVFATGEDLGATFASVADGLTAAHYEPETTAGERFELSVEASGLEALLFDYLDELIYQRDVRAVLPAEHRVTVDRERLSLEASARGVPLSSIDAREIKAVTYSEMRLEETEDGWEAYVVFDV
ncbi:MAG: archease [Natronomonas sp.]